MWASGWCVRAARYDLTGWKPVPHDSAGTGPGPLHSEPRTPNPTSGTGPGRYERPSGAGPGRYTLNPEPRTLNPPSGTETGRYERPSGAGPGRYSLNPEPRTLNPPSGTETGRYERPSGAGPGRYTLNPEPRTLSAASALLAPLRLSSPPGTGGQATSGTRRFNPGPRTPLSLPHRAAGCLGAGGISGTPGCGPRGSSC